MNSSWFKKNWFYIVAALITVFGLVTGKFFFLLIAFPFGLFKFSRKKNSHKDKEK
jgi:hypothetical protein